jgi:hypothetical protein
MAQATVAEVALMLLNRRRGHGGLGARQCEELAQLMTTAADEARILSKSGAATAAALREAKEALLRCRAPTGDSAAHDERQRVIGLLEDMLRGLAETEGIRVQWLAVAVAAVAGPSPSPDKPRTLPFNRNRKGGGTHDAGG